MIHRKSIIIRWSELFLILATTSCSTRPHLSDLEIKGECNHVYFKGKAFTGTALSSDGKTMSITCHNGIVDSIVVYHGNGRRAIRCTSLYGKGDFYDSFGTPICIEDFIRYYPGFVEQISAASYELKGL